ncbi:MAG: hypothetical protein JWR37_5235 [Mycobacterium sp.]|jgi:hypothetical protein|nr:hypothetical protein [Mycobacterium sp.]
MTAEVLTSPPAYALLAAAQAGDAVACTIPIRTITECLDDVGFPKQGRWIFPVVKAASAVGLLSVFRYPALARFTTVMLTIYFVLAVGAHVRARDFGRNAAAAASLLATFAVLAAKGPSHQPVTAPTVGGAASSGW